MIETVCDGPAQQIGCSRRQRMQLGLSCQLGSQQSTQSQQATRLQ